MFLLAIRVVGERNGPVRRLKVVLQVVLCILDGLLNTLRSIDWTAAMNSVDNDLYLSCGKFGSFHLLLDQFVRTDD